MAVHMRTSAIVVTLLVLAAFSGSARAQAPYPPLGGAPCPEAYGECPPPYANNGAPNQERKCRCGKKRQAPGGPVTHCGIPAPRYPVPFPTPRPTVPTYLWYPPMMPHNSLPHYRGTYSYRHAPGLSRTTVSWHPTYFLNAADKLHNMIELPR